MSDEIIHKPEIKITWLVGTVVAFGLFVVIGIYSKRMTRDYTSYDQDRAAQRYATLAKVRHDENALLYPVDAQGNPTAEWVDQGKGIVRIPIDEAMALEIDTLKNQPAGAGIEINPPAAAPPAAAPASTTGATNAAAATPPAGAPASKTAPAKK